MARLSDNCVEAACALAAMAEVMASHRQPKLRSDYAANSFRDRYYVAQANNKVAFVTQANDLTEMTFGPGQDRRNIRYRCGAEAERCHF
jgi:hypothetical protein